jgi:RND family efflux transporter MFP subunit
MPFLFRAPGRILIMNRFFRAFLPLVVLGGCGYLAWWFISNRPETPTIEAPPAVVRVEGTKLQRQTYPVRVRSQGTVQPRTRSTLLPEVAAKILEISPSFRPGGFFKAGEMLLKLDPVDYETALVVAKASLAEAEVVLAEESARAAQARENWRALGKTGEPGALALRLPQVAKAEADVAAAQARIAQAERDLERTVIRAPYDGQVLEQLVDVGQFVNEGTALGQIFAVDYVEIRLPLPERQMRFLSLPERYRDGATTTGGAPVTLHSVVGGAPASWDGFLVRVEGAIDESTRQITAVAQVNDPYAKRGDGHPPLRIGQFLEAEIEGQVLADVFVIPRRAMRAGNEILLITPENKLRRVTVDPIIADTETIIVSADSGTPPHEGDVLCLTPIPFAAEGATVLPLIDGVMETTGAPGPGAGRSDGDGKGKGNDRGKAPVPPDTKAAAAPGETPRSS